MASEPNKITVDVQLGPKLTCVLRVLDAINDALKVIPEHHTAETRELIEAGLELKSLCSKELRERKP